MTAAQNFELLLDFGAYLKLGGAEAQILTDSGESSALSGLTENDGLLLLRGDSVYGAGGASLTTTAPFTNVDTTDVDHLKGDGGSSVTFGGTLTNEGTFDIGNGSLSAANDGDRERAQRHGNARPSGLRQRACRANPQRRCGDNRRYHSRRALRTAS